LLLGFVQVVLRDLFSTGFIWADIASRHLVLWIGFMGAAMGTSQGRHIHVDVLTKFLPDLVNKGLAILTNAFASIVCAALCEAGWTFVRNERSMPNEFIFTIPSWVPALIAPIGLGLIAFHFAVRVARSVVLLQKQAS
jgi:TRAP-type C4-dicarboxylate transport system permease small subunit